ncbi:MAG: adenosine kinase [Desulfobacterales bacterium]|nr:adenosine kinase [Desulfobacterales bacterium]
MMPNQWFQPDHTRKRIVGIGSALVDILVPTDDAFVAQTGVPKGGMIYFEPPVIDQVLKDAGTIPQIVPGGAACNTITGVARLGGEARFTGKRGRDEFGERFEAALVRHGVDTLLVESATPTGRVLSLITPDSQRTMLTYLGAASEMRPDEVSPATFKDCAVALIEGYLVYNRELFQHAMQSAHEAGARIALDLASFTVVAENHRALTSIVARYVDILIVNEDEAHAFTGQKDEMAALGMLTAQADMAVVKLGARGSLIGCGEQVIRTPAHGKGDVVDTTGAGDLWASGFLYGLVQGLPLAQCAQLASACGYEVCRVVGASIPEQGWQRIRPIAATQPDQSGRKEIS